jgi:hypothetical protein
MKNHVVSAMKQMFDKTLKKRGQEMGRLGAEHVKENYSFETFNEQWVNFMLKVNEESGSWDTRKNYEPWECIEL